MEAPLQVWKNQVAAIVDSNIHCQIRSFEGERNEKRSIHSCKIESRSMDQDNSKRKLDLKGYERESMTGKPALRFAVLLQIYRGAHRGTWKVPDIVHKHKRVPKTDDVSK